MANLQISTPDNTIVSYPLTIGRMADVGRALHLIIYCRKSVTHSAMPIDAVGKRNHHLVPQSHDRWRANRCCRG